MTPAQPEEPANGSKATDGSVGSGPGGSGSSGNGPVRSDLAGSSPADGPERGKARQKSGGLRRLFARLTADPSELQAEQLQQSVVASGAQPIATCADREKVCVAGTLRTVTFRPRGGVPALEANLWDGTGEVAVIWLGRREIPGITPGRNIRVRGRITCPGGHRAIYNPIYELQPAMAE
jgi:hypothetical protein